MDWADTFDSTLRVLHIAEQRDFTTDIRFRGFKDLVEEKAQDHTIEFDLVIQKQFLTGVADYLTEYPVGLFVLVRYKKNMLEKLLSPDHTKQLSYHAKVPMLVLVGDDD
ncbi:MAG: hypothetical protein U5K69_07965 [Balneolaceae bacterium]|nr:hypothetical protein [Balneolaceae bacterium]